MVGFQNNPIPPILKHSSFTGSPICIFPPFEHMCFNHRLAPPYWSLDNRHVSILSIILIPPILKDYHLNLHITKSPTLIFPPLKSYVFLKHSRLLLHYRSYHSLSKHDTNLNVIPMSSFY